jgi:hypothetical protein
LLKFSHKARVLNPSDKPTGVRWVVFGQACGTSWLLYLHRYTFALIKPELVRRADVRERFIVLSRTVSEAVLVRSV